MDMNFFKKRTKNQTNEQVQSNEASAASTPDIRSLQTTSHIKDNIEKLKTPFSSTQDFDTRYFSNGDQKYGMDKLGIQIHLWAYKLKFKHPTKDEIMEFVYYPDFK